MTEVIQFFLAMQLSILCAHYKRGLLAQNKLYNILI